MTLYHWDLPSTLEREGGWLNRATAYAFADYAEIVTRRLGDRVANWITLNEPRCSAYLGYGIGVHAPGLRDRQSSINAAHHLLLGHGLAVQRMRTHLPSTAKVGITLVLQQVYGADERAETARDVELTNEFSNGWFLGPIYRGAYPERFFEHMALNPPPIQEGDLNSISAPLDFLGVNNYSRILVRGTQPQPLADCCEYISPVPNACYTDLGWEIYPNGLRDVLVNAGRNYPVGKLYVTENGAAFPDVWNGGDTISDLRRVDFLHAYITACAEAIEQGAPLCGYFVWSLMDNFEWSEGYAKRFGLIYIDYPTQRRVVKESGYWVLEMAGGCVVQRERSSEFHATGTGAELVARYERWLTAMREVLQALPVERMDQLANVSAQYHPTLDDEPMTVRDALLHAVEHCALHQGHLELTRQLLGYAPAGEQ